MGLRLSREQAIRRVQRGELEGKCENGRWFVAAAAVERERNRVRHSLLGAMAADEVRRRDNPTQLEIVAERACEDLAQAYAIAEDDAAEAAARTSKP